MLRHGPTTLFAALEVATGKITCTHAEVLAFWKQFAKAYPPVELHLVCDSYPTHKHPTLRALLLIIPDPAAPTKPIPPLGNLGVPI